VLMSVILKLHPQKLPDAKIVIGQLIGIVVLPAWPGLSVYAADVSRHRVLRLGQTMSNGDVFESDSIGAAGYGINQFVGPYDVWVNAAGQIYVADDFSYRLIRFDDMTGAGWTSLVTACPPRLCSLQSVVGDGRGGGGLLSYGGQEGVYRASLAAAPVFLGLVPAASAPGSGFGFHDVFPDRLGRIYATHDDDRLWRFDDDRGTGAVSLPLSGSPGHATLFIDALNRIYVADECQLTRYDDMTGAGKVSYPAAGCAMAFREGATGAGVDDYGRIYFTRNVNGVGEVYRMSDMTGRGLVRLASFPNAELVSIWVDDR
jgi:hypothetical protein